MCLHHNDVLVLPANSKIKPMLSDFKMKRLPLHLWDLVESFAGIKNIATTEQLNAWAEMPALNKRLKISRNLLSLGPHFNPHVLKMIQQAKLICIDEIDTFFTLPEIDRFWASERPMQLLAIYNLGPNSLKAFSRLLAICPLIIEIRIHNSCLPLSEMFSQCQLNRLCKLTFHETYLAADQVEIILHAFVPSVSLRHLQFTACSLTWEAGKVVGAFLTNNESVEELVLSRNSLCLDGARAVVGALLSNVTLRRLALVSDPVGPRLGKYIADMLKTNRRLDRLRLENTGLTKEAGREVANAYAESSTLVRLGLSCNEVGACVFAYVLGVEMRKCDIWAFARPCRECCECVNDLVGCDFVVGCGSVGVLIGRAAC
mmetsp:Transcript_29939/g.47563  ORF Transcript_29939/g.47563 Transcript_29939/m.47563 type:complete len:373 (+) Transcript_29939:955-2073(+)